MVFASDSLEFLFLEEYFIGKSPIVPGFKGEKASFRPVLAEEEIQKETEDWQEEEDQNPSDRRCRIPPLVKDNDKNQDKLDNNNNKKDCQTDGQEYTSMLFSSAGMIKI
jgi:hypothetical protein